MRRNAKASVPQRRPALALGLANPRSASGQLWARSDLVTLVGLKIITVASLIQPQRLDCCFVDCSGYGQAVIALEICEGRSRINAQRACDWSNVVACILQRSLDIRDHLVREQITVGVDRPIVIVVALQWIVAIGWIPVAPVQEIISSRYENDRVTMIVPPVAVMPLVPVTAERFVMADAILFVLPLFVRRRFWRFLPVPLRSRLWIAVCGMPLRVDRRERSIVNPKS